MENPSRTRRPRRRRAGFSILEAIVAAAVLGIGLIALVKLHTAAMRGMKASRDVGIATDIATQVAEQFMVEPPVGGNLPNCAVQGGCRAGTGSTLFTADKGVNCTKWVEDGHIRDIGGNLVAAPYQEAVAVTNPTLRYRVDYVITNHPDAGNHANARIIQIYVCWRGDDNYVQQVQTTRVVAQGY